MKKILLVLLPLVLVAACAGGTKRDASEHNDADVTFVQQMLPHHQQAIQMSDLVAAAGATPQVVDLAARIDAGQQPEIRQMQQWLEEWDVPAHEHDMADHEHGSMPGMMTDAQMAKLESSSGSQFSTLWTDMMIDHHEGAIEMATTVLRDGENPEVKKLAEHVVAHQQSEIDEMEALR